MKTNLKMRRGFTLVELLVVIAIIATLAGVGVPAIIAQKKKGDRSEASQNAKQIGLALFGFEQDYGSFPSDATGQDVKDNNQDVAWSFRQGSSNEYFRQLIAAGHLDQEKPFYCKAEYTKKPDNIMDTSSDTLDDGEVGFSYIMKTTSEPLSGAANSALPIVCASSYEARSDGTFDRDIYDKKAVVLHLDMSVTEETVKADKTLALSGGKGLLDVGRGTVWGTNYNSRPILKAPAKKGGGSRSAVKGPAERP